MLLLWFSHITLSNTTIAVNVLSISLFMPFLVLLSFLYFSVCRSFSILCVILIFNLSLSLSLAYSVSLSFSFLYLSLILSLAPLYFTNTPASCITVDICLALPSLLSSLLWYYSGARRLHLCMGGGVH